MSVTTKDVAKGIVLKTTRTGIKGRRKRRFKVLRVNRENETVFTVDQHHRFYTFDFAEVTVDPDHRFLTRPLPKWAYPRRGKRR